MLYSSHPPGQLDVRSEGVRLPWACHAITLLLPEYLVLNATKKTGKQSPKKRRRKNLRGLIKTRFEGVRLPLACHVALLLPEQQVLNPVKKNY